MDAFRRSEEICNHRMGTALHSSKQQRRTTLLNDTPMDLGRLQIRINLDFNGMEFSFLAEQLEKMSKT